MVDKPQAHGFRAIPKWLCARCVPDLEMAHADRVLTFKTAVQHLGADVSTLESGSEIGKSENLQFDPVCEACARFPMILDP
jgi:hypothetical protein